VWQITGTEIKKLGGPGGRFHDSPHSRGGAFQQERTVTERGNIDRLIINSPWEEPKHYWSYNRETCTFSLVEGRRSVGYVVACENSKSFPDPCRNHLPSI
jgi:hypothetical protein